MKYIVEFEDEPCMYEDEVHFYKCIQAPWWGLSERVIKQLTPYQPDVPDTNVGNKISKFFDGIEEIFADIRERHGDDSVCGLCEYDGAYMGQSGDWCNECPGFDKDDCFKLSDKARERWTEEIINALPTVQPEQRWIPSGEKPPEEGSYLVWMPFAPPENRIAVATFHYGYWNIKTPISAWMPLPEPYKGGDTE